MLSELLGMSTDENDRPGELTPRVGVAAGRTIVRVGRGEERNTDD